WVITDGGKDCSSLTPGVPTITGPDPSVGDINVEYDFIFVATDLGDNIRYGIDWDSTDAFDVVDEWLPSDVPTDTYVLSGVEETIKHKWSSIGEKKFQALTEDDGGLQSDWTEHTITIGTGNTAPVAIIKAPNVTTEKTSPLPLNAEFFDSDDSPQDTFNGFRWFDGSCATGTLLYSSSTLQADNPTGPYSQNLSDGNHDISLEVVDNHGATSTCETFNIDINPPTECNNGSDDIDTDTWFDNGGGDIAQADPACYDVGDPLNPVYHGDYLSEDNNPQCSSGIDNDGDGLIGTDDAGCHDDGDPTNASSYNKFDNVENNCGTGVCEVGETYILCPSDCPFLWIEF
ncbi:MAG: hypothetical protein KAI25_11265, partial [Hyphomicrobiaceae bacterium]|nr:hypothetical protein [Hyphomicrobiaceae bacterium]